jgi:hypothetical protein
MFLDLFEGFFDLNTEMFLKYKVILTTNPTSLLTMAFSAVPAVVRWIVWILLLRNDIQGRSQ